ncbi:alpha/beta hydrolase fold domain-containing protein [Streptomyces sp. ME02-8801-2C]|uniref:alpha/beta hydrolase fold domain-containing protein n=1 Tax=Streptomyces sp. ME02-8801-2C TaxID=3028680 RepID=UPI0029BD8B6E|nr:alpha/beta hydrolase fold domain-containing protein [Streptomyces sp. ME02-8801-2C]MDX3456372.1 alpha/beta hydrolase fold domain-containing protein [Streptomyces sp. ME02-8801-2C]
MSLLARPAVASLVAKTMQRVLTLADRRSGGQGSTAAFHARLPEFPRATSGLTIPTSVAPARVVVYRPPVEGAEDPAPPVHVNFHGGGFVMALTETDDAFCRAVAALAGVVVVNVDYVVAPQYPFPAPPRQSYEVVRWIAENGAAHGWDGTRLTVGGQSAGGGLAAAVARQALEEQGPAIALQVLHYPPLDLATAAKDKRAAIAKPMLRPWMGEVFDSAYVPDPLRRTDRLVSPAHPKETADLKGIAPALIITAAHDRLRAEGLRYAERLRQVGSLVEHHDVAGVDHGYDLNDDERGREIYAFVSRHIRQATADVSAG